MAEDEPWPEEDPLRDAETLNRVARRRRVPRGMSEYQAAWIVDSGQWRQPAARCGDERCRLPASGPNPNLADISLCQIT